jgi:hypothetical protein
MRTIRVGPMDHNRNLTRGPAKLVRALSQAELDQVIGAGATGTGGVGSGSGGAAWPLPSGRN